MIPMSIAALVCAVLFTGAAGYISLVEHPVRLQMANGPMLAQWQPSYSRALPIQSGLAIAGGVAGAVSWFLSGEALWLVGTALLLANWPFTLLVIMPTNKRLKAIEPDRAGPETRAMLVRWGKLHDIRSVLGVAATLIDAWALAEVVATLG